MDDRLDDDEVLDEDTPPASSRVRVLVFSAAALAILVVGAAIGMLITLSTALPTCVLNVCRSLATVRTVSMYPSNS